MFLLDTEPVNAAVIETDYIPCRVDSAKNIYWLVEKSWEKMAVKRIGKKKQWVDSEFNV